MSYTHLLVAVDLSDDSALLIDKAVKLAQTTNAKVSLIHVDHVQDDEFTRKIVSSITEKNSDDNDIVTAQTLLDKIKTKSEYPISQTLVGYGALTSELESAVEKYGVDLIVCGHHQDFWHNLNSNAKQMIKTLPVDMLVIPLR